MNFKGKSRNIKHISKHQTDSLMEPIKTMPTKYHRDTLSISFAIRCIFLENLRAANGTGQKEAI